MILQILQDFFARGATSKMEIYTPTDLDFRSELEPFKETCSRLKRQRRYLKIKPGTEPQEFKSACKQALKARFNWR